MRKIIEGKYIYLKSDSHGSVSEMSETLNEYIKEGWQPLGSPILISNEYETGYGVILRVVQLLVKYKDDPKWLWGDHENPKDKK